MLCNKKILVFVICIIACLYTSVYAIRLLSKKIALKKILPGIESITEEKRALTASDKEKIKGRLGGVLVFDQEGSQSSKVAEANEYTFYFGMKGDKKVGVAIIELQPGKWGPVEYIINLDPKTARVKDLAVMSFTEKRGRPIARRNFLKQFVGKGSKDPLKIRKDYRGITGATISSKATCFAVKKISAVYEVLYLQKDTENKE
jgi:Na+-translocating ferredoxin:NAD+ oxidoreductase RnfG subunit